jgi:adenine-specific DNA-methyltransferase
MSSIVWEKDAGRKNDTAISSSHDYIFVIAKNSEIWRKSRNLLEKSDEHYERYKNPDNDPRGAWRQGADGTAKSGSESLRYEVTLPSGRIVTPPSGNYWRFSKETLAKAVAENRVYFGKDGDKLPVIKKYLTDVQTGLVPKTWWPSSEVGSNQEARRDHLRKLLPDIEPFATPKPERLLERIIHIATNAGDWVLDSFAGSGTTGAVAHKMGRKWIMVELGEHCHTHIIPRLQKVIDGSDQGGISKTVNWQGGGGFRYYKLAPSLLERDRWGNFTINPAYNAAMLSEALCKQHGYTYAPSDTIFWQQGYATDSSFLYATTQNLAFAQLQTLAEEVGENRALLIIAAAWRGISGEEASRRWPNLTLQKIPNSILHLCEWAKDDYSLNIANLPMAQPESKTDKPKPKPINTTQGSLFGDEP